MKNEKNDRTKVIVGRTVFIIIICVIGVGAAAFFSEELTVANALVGIASIWGVVFVAAGFHEKSSARERAKILTILRAYSREMHVRDIVAAGARRDAIFVHLARLEEAGLVASREEELTFEELRVRGGHKRRLYRITAEGLRNKA